MAVALWPRAVYLVISMTMTTTFATAVAAEISLASDFCRRPAAPLPRQNGIIAKIDGCHYQFIQTASLTLSNSMFCD